ncbi:MAG: type VI secretion system ImpA family N-terminal domain-containing protein [Pseudomonadota bacterium]
MNIDFQSLYADYDENGDGPDLSDEVEFSQLSEEVEGFLPSRADDFHFAFRKANPEIDGFAERCMTLLERTRDLRLIVVIAKLAALKGSVGQFADSLSLIHFTLAERWDTVHPTASGTRHSLRGVTVERLAEFASVVLPLQYAVLVTDRLGNITYRDQAVASGKVLAREGDVHPSASDIDRILSRCDVDALVGVRDLAARMVNDLTAITTIWAEKATEPPSLDLKRLGPILAEMLTFLDEAVGRRNPELALKGPEKPRGDPDRGDGPETGPDPDATGAVTSLTDAKAALSAASRYFEHHEPSSPSLILIRKAQALIGLTFVQMLQQMAPDSVSVSAIQLAGRTPLKIPMEKLSTEFEYMELEAPEEAEPSQTFEAEDRAAAVNLLSEVARWYRSSEPSNPIPLLLDKAKEVTAKDFSQLLSDFAIPEE